MYCSLEEAWADPLMVATESGFQLRQDWDQPQSARRGCVRSSLSEPPEVQSPPPLSSSPSHSSASFLPSHAVEGFSGGPAYGQEQHYVPGLRDELQRLRQELALLRRERREMLQRLDLLSFLIGGILLFVIADWMRRHTG